MAGGGQTIKASNEWVSVPIFDPEDPSKQWTETWHHIRTGKEDRFYDQEGRLVEGTTAEIKPSIRKFHIDQNGNLILNDASSYCFRSRSQLEAAKNSEYANTLSQAAGGTVTGSLGPHAARIEDVVLNIHKDAKTTEQVKCRLKQVEGGWKIDSFRDVNNDEKKAISPGSDQYNDAMKQLLVDKRYKMATDTRAVNNDPSKLNFDLLAAASKGDEAGIRALLSQGANVNAKGSNDETPLMMAIQSGNLGAINAILEKQPDVTVQTKNGLTAIQLANQKGLSDVASRLRLMGAVDEPEPDHTPNPNNVGQQQPYFRPNYFPTPQQQMPQQPYYYSPAQIPTGYGYGVPIVPQNSFSFGLGINFGGRHWACVPPCHGFGFPPVYSYHPVFNTCIGFNGFSRQNLGFHHAHR